MTKRKINQLYKRIDSITNEFDRHFDNTVVDTYAFEHALRSEAFADLVFSRLIHPAAQSNSELKRTKQAVCDYVIDDVEKTYRHTHRRVVDRGTYYDYIDSLISRILAA